MTPCQDCRESSRAFCPHARTWVSVKEAIKLLDLCDAVEGAQDTWSRAVSTALHRSLSQIILLETGRPPPAKTAWCPCGHPQCQHDVNGCWATDCGCAKTTP